MLSARLFFGVAGSNLKTIHGVKRRNYRFQTDKKIG